MSDRLMAAARGGQVTRLIIEQAEHEDLFRTGGNELLAGLQQFIQRIASPS